MKIKRILALLAAIACISMTACSSEDSSDDDSRSSRSSSSVQSDESTADAGTDNGSDSADESEAEEVTAPDKPLEEIIAEYTPAEGKSPELKEVGKLKVKDVSFRDDNIYVLSDKDEVTIYDYKGEELAGGKAEYVNKLGNTGLYVYNAKGTEETVYVGLIDADGNEIISPDEKAGLIKEIDDRFVMVFFPDAETKNEDEAIYFATKRQFALDVSEEDVMYTGKVKVYDTQGRKYLENTTVTTNPRYTVYGDIISFSDSSSNYVYVSADDKVLEFEDGITPTGGKLLTKYKDGKTYAYDHDMNLQFTTPYSISKMNNTDDFYTITDLDTSKRGIIHYTGTIILEPKYNTVDYVDAGCFTYASTDDYQKNGILDLEGKEITKDDYKYIYYSGVPGYFNVCKADGKYDLIDIKTGNAVYSDADSYVKLGEYISTGSDYLYFVPGKGDVSLKTKYSGTYYGNYLLNVNSDKILYDLYTGEKIQEGFDEADFAFGRLYITKGKEITIYEVN